MCHALIYKSDLFLQIFFVDFPYDSSKKTSMGPAFDKSIIGNLSDIALLIKLTPKMKVTTESNLFFLFKDVAEFFQCIFLGEGL